MISRLFYLLNQKKLLKSKGSHPLKTFDNHKAIFFHIPKTGGNSIYESLFEKQEWGHRDVFYYKFIFGKKKFENYFKFCFVRNPINRLYSAYSFLKNGGINKQDEKFNQDHLSSFSSFEDFVKNGLHKKEIINWVHFQPQYLFVTDKKSKVVVDFVGKLENIETDFITLKKLLNKKKATLSHLNKGKREKIKISDSSLQVIKKIYKRDFELFYPELLAS
jgi:hypothetical protein